MAKRTKDMFKNYDDEKMREQHLPEYEVKRRPDRLVGTANAQLIKNIKGEEIGIRAPEGSAFSIYFTFDGFVEDMTLANLLSEAEFGFELRNHRHQTILSAPVVVYADSCMASVDLVSEKDGVLSYGNYYIYLYMVVDGLTYTLFDERDGVVSIE